MGLKAETKSAWIMAAIAATEGTWVIWVASGNPGKFVAFMGFAPGRGGTFTGWLLAGLVTAAFVAFAARLPSVRANLLRPSWLKLLALVLALAAGILEEAVFRATLMNALQYRGAGVAAQILFSGLAFGAVHGIWGLFGRSLRAAAGATVVTGVLGTALAVVYLAAGRSLLPCIAAHFLMDALIEPGLVLAACRGEMGGSRVLTRS